MPRMTGAQALVEHLRVEGVTHLFGLPGRQVLSIMDALRETPDLRFVLSRHEQGAAYMAYGYARATRTPGVCLSTVGPGATNLITGVASAFKASTPMIAITGKQDRVQLQKDVVQELDHTALFKPITRWSYMATNVEKIPEAMRRAFRWALADGGGPVHIEFPRDILAEGIEVEIQDPSRYRADDRPPCRPEQVREALALLEGARSPVILAGRQTLDDNATGLLRQLAERYHLPVAIPSINLDVFPTTHPLCLGPIGRNGWPTANRVVNQADVLLALGGFDPFSTLLGNDIVSARSKILHVCRHPEQIGLLYPVELGIVGTTDSFLTQLLEIGEGRIPENPIDVAGLKTDWETARVGQADPKASPVKAQHLVRTLRRLLPRDGIAIVEGGNYSEHIFAHWDTHEPNTFYFSDNMGAVGSGLPTALGVKLARPDRQVVALCGDCGFMMNVGELETAVREKVNVVAVVFNDFGMGNNRAYQKANYGGRLFADSYSNPDFGKLAELFGAWGCQVQRGEELEEALHAALAAGRPAVVDVLIDREDLARVIFKP